MISWAVEDTGSSTLYAISLGIQLYIELQWSRLVGIEYRQYPFSFVWIFIANWNWNNIILQNNAT